MFATIDWSRWMIVDKAQIVGENYRGMRRVVKSALKDTPDESYMSNDPNENADPTIILTGQATQTLLTSQWVSKSGQCLR